MRNPKTEELLYFLLWSAEKLMRPTFRNLTDSYESWAYRNGILRQVQRLEGTHLIERHPRPLDDRTYRLTEAGRIQALGGLDPEAQWTRPWDGRWRLALFDVPTSANLRRDQLRRYLRSRRYGFLQGSVWITPDSVAEERQAMADGQIDVESLIFLEATTAAGESDQEIVRGAWDFERIGRLHRRHLRILDQIPQHHVATPVDAQRLRRWARRELRSWKNLIRLDPFLPRALLPDSYRGEAVWKCRVDVLCRAGHLIRDFRG